ncbi:pitrilysin family protein [Polaribacter sp. 20A6]|uniref:M16 family metallopeptidase n=1 Tax=Polaribacter sp. 20A6 TaxID=2687289 RepID=UPI0013FD852B|nr:pitrilysin family protein [Polaribacter sp. 20A6]
MKNIYILIFAICFSFKAIAQVDRSMPPEADEPVKLNVGKLIPIQLDNGLRIYLAPVKEYPKFTISVNIELPGYDEEERLAEKKILNSAYSNKLSEKYPKGEIDSISNYYGALLNASMYGGTIKGMKQDVNLLLDVYVDALLHPVITDAYIQKRQEEQVEKDKKKISKVNTPKRPFSIEKIIDSLLFGNEKKVIETQEKVKANYNGLTVSDIENFKNDRIVSNNSLIVVVGDFTEKECKELMMRYFGAWKSGEPYVKNSPINKKTSIIKKRKIVVVDAPNAVQSDISFRWHLGDAYTYFKDDIKLQVLNEIFGASQLSYLYKNLREDKGLCYFIRSSVGASAVGGSGSVSTSVRNDQTAYAIENIILEMLRLRNGKVSASDLKIAKNSLIGSYTRSLNAIAPIPYITFAMQKDDYNLPDDYLQSKVEKYYEVNVDDIMAMSQKYIDPFKSVIYIKGKVSELKGTLEKFGDVIYFDEKGNTIE